MKIKHYGYFVSSAHTLNWENLRNDKDEKPYFLPYKKEEYITKVEVDEPSNLTQFIIQKINQVGLSKLFSIGSGIASLEYQLKKYSNFKIIVSDYSASVLRLKKFEIFDDALDLANIIEIWCATKSDHRETVRKKAYKVIDERYNPHKQIVILKTLFHID